MSCKRNDILKLKLEDYQNFVEQASLGFEKAGKFLFQQKIFSNRDLPYSTQIVPLAAILALLGDKADNDAIRNKLVRWYWCGVFGELYGSAIESRFARDVVETLNWINGGQEPSTITESSFAPNRLLTLRTRNSAAYKGLYALLMRDGCLDFRTGVPIEVQSYFDEAVDIHHIFPRTWCEKKENRIEAKFYDSIINKTALSYRTNRMIGGNAPSSYLKSLRDRESIEEQRQIEILSSHVIPVDNLKADDFFAFFNARKDALLNRIEQATGKTIVRETAITTPLTAVDDEGDIGNKEEEP